jgi:AcrR family transcriptional regulator
MPSQKTRGRPRTFDIDEAMNQAIQVFWAKGYEHTSLEDLLRAMKLSKSSFYQTFGSKQALYHRTIEDRFSESIAAAQAAGEIPSQKDPRKMARALTSTFYGMQVMGRARLGREILEDVFETALTQLRAPDPR